MKITVYLQFTFCSHFKALMNPVPIYKLYNIQY